MKCPNCNYENNEEWTFCRQCGYKLHKKSFCRECGNEIGDDAKYCTICGADINKFDNDTFNPLFKREPKIRNSLNEVQGEQNSRRMDRTDSSEVNKVGKKATKIDEHSGWNMTYIGKQQPTDTFDWFSKILLVAFPFIVLFLVVSICNKNGFAIFISILQLLGLIFSGLFHKNVITVDFTALKYLIITLSILLTFFNGMSYSLTINVTSPSISSGKKESNNTELTTSETVDVKEFEKNTNSTPQGAIARKTSYTIEKNSQYALLYDEHTLYYATAISNSSIKISRGIRDNAFSQDIIIDSEFETIDINSEKYKFRWVDDAHLAFSIELPDDKNINDEKVKIFTIDVWDYNHNYVSNCSYEVKYYKYDISESCRYRAIQITPSYLKIEKWIRKEDSEKYFYCHDCGIITINNDNYMFIWNDFDKTSFEINLCNGGTISGNELSIDNTISENEIHASLVNFEIENVAGKYATVKEYYDIQQKEKNGIAVLESSYTYRHKNYLDVESSLREAGYTNISTTIMYDIIWGWTDEGEVESVSIDGKTDFNKGDTFLRKAPVVITYHMNYSDDPNRQKSELDLPSESLTSNANSSSTSKNEQKDESVSYSTNKKSDVKDGNKGVYAYKKADTLYNIYYIIDFDEGFAYSFTDAEYDSAYYIAEIDSGDLNSVVTLIYRDGNDERPEYLHFKYSRQPDHLVVVDYNQFVDDYYTTSLSTALRIKKTKTAAN